MLILQGVPPLGGVKQRLMGKTRYMLKLNMRQNLEKSRRYVQSYY